MIYLAITYVLTGQPFEFDRIYWVIMVACLMMLCAQSWGYFLGATMPVKVIQNSPRNRIESLTLYDITRYCFKYTSGRF